MPNRPSFTAVISNQLLKEVLNMQCLTSQGTDPFPLRLSGKKNDNSQHSSPWV